jgi:O-antigen/teichoic acid export membrane protein
VQWSFQSPRLSESLQQGLRWNLGAFAIIGASGLAMNILIARSYAPWVLGAFNQVLAIYIVAAQLATFGVQNSVLYRVSTLVSRAQAREAASTGLVLAAGLASTVALLLWFLRDSIAMAFSPAVGSGLTVAVPGLCLFPLNKVMLANLNGMRWMRAYAIGNMLRYVLIVVGILLVMAFALPGEYVALSLTFSEVVLFMVLFAINKVHLCVPSRASFRNWARPHLRFGFWSVSGGILSELNTRTDVLMLGLFVNDSAVGVYSMGSTFAEGMFQLVMVLRYNYDPIVARLIAEREWHELREVVTTGKKLAYLTIGASGLFAVMLYPLVLNLVVGNTDYSGSHAVFAILMAGIIAAAGYLPFIGILQQGGRPAAQSLLSLLVISSNIIFNLFLIPKYGILGAATATSIAFALYVPFLFGLTRKVLGFGL